MARFIYTPVAEGHDAEPFLSDEEYDVGATLPIGPGVWTVDQVEDHGGTDWDGLLQAETTMISRRLHCTVFDASPPAA